MNNMVNMVVLLALFALSFYSISHLRLESFFKKGSTIQIQLFYILSSMALAYLVYAFLNALKL